MPKVSPDNIAAIVKLSSEGLSNRAISDQTGISKSTVWGVLKRNKPEPSIASTLEATPPDAAEHYDDDKSQASVESIMIDPGLAFDFVDSIGAAVPQGIAEAPSKDSAKDAKTLSQRINLAESFLKLGDDEMPKPKSKSQKLNKLITSVLPPDFTPAVESGPSKADLIASITLNVEAFEPLLRSIVKPSPEVFLDRLYSKSQSELSTLLAVLIKTRTIANVTNQLRHTVNLTAQGCEALTSSVLGMRTQGFATAISTQDEEVRMILREIALEQVDAFNKLQRPELRLAMLFSTTLLATDASNRLKDREKALPPAVAQKHADL